MTTLTLETAREYAESMVNEWEGEWKPTGKVEEYNDEYEGHRVHVWFIDEDGLTFDMVVWQGTPDTLYGDM